MLSIGEFSRICKVSPKTLRYYAEIGLLLPEKINPENGYRYYAIEQLETMLLINRLKEYRFSLEEMKEILKEEGAGEEKLCLALLQKKKEMECQVQEFERTLKRLDYDISNLRQGNSILSYLENIEIQLTEVPEMNLLYIRKNIPEQDFPQEYGKCFGKLFQRIAEEKLTAAAPPMVLFHSAEFSPCGLDTEFAVPVKEYVTGTRDFAPGLCLKTVLQGAYSDLPSVYIKQIEWAEREGYACTNALFECYVTDPSEVAEERGLITEVYYPVKKKA